MKELECEAEQIAQSWSWVSLARVADSWLVWDTWLDLRQLRWHFETVFVVLVL